MPSDRFEAGGRHAAAVAAIRVAAKLTRHDAPLEIRREAIGRLREDAVSRANRVVRVDVEQPSGSCSFENFCRRRRRSATTRVAIGRLRRSVDKLADLRRVQTHPDQARVRILLPEGQEFSR
jgi:hypothetical protein